MPFDGLHIGHYILLRSIGSGGMGEVYLAEDPRIHRQVAIKVVRTEGSTYPHDDSTKDAQRLFLREAKAIARLDHPHILPLFDYGEENVNGTMLTYLVMPFRPEGSLTGWLEQRNSELLSLADVVQIVRQAASALQYAHDQQIIHQDVKPSNFLMRANNERPHLPDVVLADFGVARLSSATSSVSHSIRGTPTYMAPEQWSGEPVSATDQYALAVMTYELLTGHPPFQGPPMRMMYLHTNTAPQPPSASNPSLPKEVDTVLLTALAKKPEERFLSITAFARALESAAQYSDAATVVRTPDFASTRDLRATLAISKREAQNGTTRTLNLAGGRQVTASVPAGAYDGQIIRLNDASAGTLIITLSVKETEPTFQPSTPSQSFDKTIPSSNPGIPAEPVPPAKRNSKDAVIPVPYSSSTSDSPEARPIIIKHQGIPVGTTILLFGLALLIVIGSFFFYIQASNRGGSSTNTTTTTNGSNTTPPAQSNSPDTTATAQAFGTNAAATTQTNNANATATAASTHTFPPPNASLVLNDPLSDNSQGHGWDTTSDSGGVCQFTGGVYDVIERQTRTVEYCPANNTSYSNFAYEVQMTIIQGDMGGMIIRDEQDGKSYYFRLKLDGQYDLVLYTDVKPAATLTSGQATSFNTGLNQMNLIETVERNSIIELYVNRQFIDSVNVGTYNPGYIGVFANNRGNPTEVMFSNAKVWIF